jgi:hypothetical protein
MVCGVQFRRVKPAVTLNELMASTQMPAGVKIVSGLLGTTGIARHHGVADSKASRSEVPVRRCRMSSPFR